MLGILAAALAAALTALLTGWLGTVGRKTAEVVLPDRFSEPISVAVEPTGVCGVAWVVPVRPSEVTYSEPVESSIKSWRDWPPAAKGSFGSPHNVLMTIQGRSEAQVVITDLTIRMLKRGPLPPQATVLRAAGCGDIGAYRWLETDLDQSPPGRVAKYDSNKAEGDLADHELTPIKFPYEISLSDAESFVITASTKKCTCEWEIDVAWSSQGKTGVTTIDDHGKPFRTTSTANAGGTCVVNGEKPDCS
jgi:hypothetical protein